MKKSNLAVKSKSLIWTNARNLAGWDPMRPDSIWNRTGKASNSLITRA
jgi:hypothetical protein